jgi:hypothetical protein
MSEKISQMFFVEKLKKANWYVREQVTDHTKNSRADVIAYHPKFDENVAFELKVPKGLFDETKALRQMIRYRNTYFDKMNVALFCYMKPTIDTYHSGYNSIDMVCKRFFWRWGFGYGSLDSMVVEFVNGENKNTLDLMNPLAATYNTDPKTKILKIREKSEKYWLNKDETDVLENKVLD